MPKLAVDEFGQRFIIPDDGGDPIPAPELGGSVRPATDAMLVEAGAGFQRIGRRMRELTGTPRDELRLEQQEEDALLAGLREEHPIASTLGGALPFAAATATAGGGLPMSAALGALEGYMDFDANEVDQLRSTATGAIGGVAGDIAGRMAGRVVNALASVRRALSETSPAARRVEAVGGRVTAGQRLDDPTVRGIETSLAGDALTNRTFEQIAATNEEVAGQSLRRALGVGGDGPITEDVLDVAATQLEEVFNTVGEAVPEIDMGEEFAERVLTLEQFKKLRGLGELPDMESGVFTGADFQTVRQALSEEMGQAYNKGQGRLGNRIREMIDDLDNALAEVTSPEDVALLNDARERWRVLQVAEQPNVITGGTVNPVTLNRRLRSTFGTTATRGRGEQVRLDDTRDLIETAAAFADPRVRPIVPTSGTAERQAVREAVSDPTGAAARALANPVIGKFEESPRAASVVGAILAEEAPLIFRQAGRQAGIAGQDPLNDLIFGRE